MGLCLTRKVGEQIQIGPNIVITVRRVGDGSCRLDIEAPETCHVYRRELSEANRRRLTLERKRASRG